MTQLILGLDVNDRGTSAAVVVDGVLQAAAQQERFCGIKQTRTYPSDAAAWCLDAVGARSEDVSTVALSVNPAIYLETLSQPHSERARFRAELLYGPLNYLIGGAGRLAGDETQVIAHMTGSPPLDLRHIRHHESHAAAAYYQSPFDEAIVCSIDAFGEKDSLVLFHAQGSRLERLATVDFPHSLGGFYASMVAFLGLRPFRDEWKLMAAATEGDPATYADRLRSLVRPAGAFGFEVALDTFWYHQFQRPEMFTHKLVDMLGPAVLPGAEPDTRFFDIAAATQLVLEETVADILGRVAAQLPTRNLCMAGGVAYNCQLNGRLGDLTPFEQIFVPAAPDDSGTSIGAALAVLHREHPEQRHPAMQHNYLGPAYSDAEIQAVLERCHLPVAAADHPAAAAAADIAAGKLVGWFQGAMEFGERALGNRSVLADPRDPQTHTRLSTALKTRAHYQPFAPSVLAEQADRYFEMAGPSPWMDKSVRCRPDRLAEIPAVVSASGSSRVQTVTREQNPLFADLIEHFRQATGLPMVVNTSFNHNESPMVRTPEDAIRTFYSSGLDALYLGSFVIRK